MCASCDVILPQRATRQIGMAAAARGDKHPVLWLLHGASDDQSHLAAQNLHRALRRAAGACGGNARGEPFLLC